MEKSEVLQKLHEGWTKLEFKKADGTLRLMTASLNANDLPVVEAKAEAAPRKQNPDVLAVWDVANAGWRSFKWANLKKVDGQDVSVG